MRIRFVRFHPVFVIRSDWLVRPKGGCAWCFLFINLVFIRSDLWCDDGLLSHELVHIDQHIRTLYVHPVLYYFSASYRLRCEVEAYRVQMCCYPGCNDIDSLRWLFAGYISGWYNIGISKEDAYLLLGD